MHADWIMNDQKPNAQQLAAGRENIGKARVHMHEAAVCILQKI